MQEIVESVKRATGMIGKIATATQEKMAGTEQINISALEVQFIPSISARLLRGFLLTR
jgi:methyl-accepting chemotaxis protein